MLPFLPAPRWLELPRLIITLLPALVLSIVLTGNMNSVQAGSIELTAAEINQKLQVHFPRYQDSPLGTLTYTRPEVIINENDNRIGITLSVTAGILKLGKLSGRGLLEGELEYKAEEYSFYLLNSRIKQIELEGLDSDTSQSLQTFIGITDDLLPSPMLIYQLNDNNLRERLAKKRLRNVTINNGMLVLEFDDGF